MSDSVRLPFEDRAGAGRALAEALTRKRFADPVVLALPRGGVTVALPIARRLAAPLDLLLVRKIGVPYQPELAVAAVMDGESPVLVIDASEIDYVHNSEDLQWIENRIRQALQPAVVIDSCQQLNQLGKWIMISVELSHVRGFS